MIAVIILTMWIAVNIIIEKFEKKEEKPRARKKTVKRVYDYDLFEDTYKKSA